MSRRIQKINELIKRELGQILLREIEFPKDILVTITRVDSSPDLNEAKIYVSVIPEGRKGKIIQILNNKVYNLQQKINQKLKMRQIPKIKFQEEKEVSQAARIEKILEELRKERK